MSKMLKITFVVDPDEMDAVEAQRLLDFTHPTGVTNVAFETMDTSALVALARYGGDVETEVVDIE
jgi:hypothetical protein